MAGLNSPKLYWALGQRTKDTWEVLLIGTLAQIGGTLRRWDRLCENITEGVVLPQDLPEHEQKFAKQIFAVVAQPYDTCGKPELDPGKFSKVPGLQVMGARYSFEVEELP